MQDGLFNMLRDDSAEVRSEVEALLAELLTELGTAEGIDFGEVVLAFHC